MPMLSPHLSYRPSYRPSSTPLPPTIENPAACYIECSTRGDVIVIFFVVFLVYICVLIIDILEFVWYAISGFSGCLPTWS